MRTKVSIDLVAYLLDLHYRGRTFKRRASLFLVFVSYLSFFLRAVPGRHFFKDCPGPWYRRFSDGQPPTLTARVD